MEIFLTVSGLSLLIGIAVKVGKIMNQLESNTKIVEKIPRMVAKLDKIEESTEEYKEEVKLLHNRLVELERDFAIFVSQKASNGKVFANS